MAPVLNLRKQAGDFMLLRMLCQDRGQDLIEYALVTALISIVAVLAIQSLGAAVGQHYQTSTTTFSGS